MQHPIDNRLNIKDQIGETVIVLSTEIDKKHQPEIVG